MTLPARSGFTLLEAIVALAIVSIVCIGVLAAQGTALRAESTANTRLPLAELARDRMVAVDMFDGQLNALPDSVTYGSLGAAQWRVTAQPVAGSRSLWTVNVVVHQGADSLVLVSRRHRAVTP